MLSVLHRTTHDPVAFDQPTPTLPERGSPPMRTPPPERGPSPSWPFGAKLIVAILAVLALAGATWVVVDLTSGDEQATTDGSAATVAELTVQRDALLADIANANEQIDIAEAERDDALARLAVLEDANDSLVDERLGLESQVSTLATTVAGLTRTRDQLTVELAETNARIDVLEGDLAVQKAITATAVSQRDALAALFPMELQATLEQADLAGDYEADITSIYCEGFSNCGTLPAFDELTIVENSNGWLRVEIDGYYDAGLFTVDGSLFAIAESTTAVPACDGVSRSATVSLTLYAHGLVIDDEGGYVVDDLGASMLVQAPATGSCPRGLGFYSVALTPAS